jgi:hypothetical protein
MGFAMSSCLWPGRGNHAWVPGDRSEVWLDKNDWLVNVALHGMEQAAGVRYQRVSSDAAAMSAGSPPHWPDLTVNRSGQRGGYLMITRCPGHGQLHVKALFRYTGRAPSASTGQGRPSPGGGSGRILGRGLPARSRWGRL